MADGGLRDSSLLRSPSEGAKKQPVVKLDVGGRIFKILRSTVERFPESLLAQMVYDFPDLLESGEPLYIDRNPKGFEWILEIYRKGNCRSAMPHMSAEDLQDELDFYQLPSALDLGLDLHKHTKFSKEAYAKEIVDKIVSEIKICGLQHFFPWRIFIYYKCLDGKIDKSPNVFVEPPCGMDDMDYIAWRGHIEFMRARKLDDDEDIVDRHRADQKIRISPVEGLTEFLCKDFCPMLMRFIKHAAAQHDLEVKFCKEDTHEWSDELRIECLTIDCVK